MAMMQFRQQFKGKVGFHPNINAKLVCSFMYFFID